MNIVKELMRSAVQIRDACEALKFSQPVEYVYNPLQYAWKMHEKYLQKYAASPKKVIFLGMNPGPFGMAQNGIPFGEINSVKDWLKLSEKIDVPSRTHPKRPILGLEHPRSEVSGKRLWGLFEQRFKTSEVFFEQHFVANYCPLVFLEASGKNRTPVQLPKAERLLVEEICDRHLTDLINFLEVDWVVGVGKFAEKRAQKVCTDIFQKTSKKVSVGGILHPSPASPAANRGWAEQATKQLEELGIW